MAPSGSLRVAIAISPAPGPFWAGRDPVSHAPKRLTVDLASAMADALGVPLKLVVYDNSGAMTDAGEWDIAFVPLDAARRLRLDFGPVYSEAESTFLVRPGLAIAAIADVDKPGIHQKYPRRRHVLRLHSACPIQYRWFYLPTDSARGRERFGRQKV